MTRATGMSAENTVFVKLASFLIVFRHHKSSFFPDKSKTNGLFSMDFPDNSLPR
jgi:hypothetical protein